MTRFTQCANCAKNTHLYFDRETVNRKGLTVFRSGCDNCKFIMIEKDKAYYDKRI